MNVSQLHSNLPSWNGGVYIVVAPLISVNSSRELMPPEINSPVKLSDETPYNFMLLDKIYKFIWRYSQNASLSFFLASF